MVGRVWCIHIASLTLFCKTVSLQSLPEMFLIIAQESTQAVQKVVGGKQVGCTNMQFSLYFFLSFFFLSFQDIHCVDVNYFLKPTHLHLAESV